MKQVLSYLDIKTKQGRLILMSLGVLFLILVFTIPFVPNEKYLNNTTINGVDVGGMTLNDVLSQFEKRTSVNVLENNEPLAQSSLSNVGATLDANSIQKLSGNDVLPKRLSLWQVLFRKGKSHKIDLTVAFQNDGLLNYLVNTVGVSNNNRQHPTNASVVLKNNELVIEKGDVGGWLDFSLLPSSAPVVNGVVELNLNTLYEQAKLNEASPELLTFKDAITQAVERQVSVVISGKVLMVDKATLMSWLIVDKEKLTYSFDFNAIQQYFSQLDSEYASVYKTRQFASTKSGTVSVQPGILGWAVDIESSVNGFISALSNTGDVQFTVITKGQGDQRLTPEQEIGNTYVEVDLLNQHLWYYQEGKLVLETDIVSGRIGTDTIAGAYYVWSKESPSVLKGYNPHTGSNYEQPVNYWMPFDWSGQGIHDASWQSSFGGDNYLNHGSLGCINVPPSTMPFLYDAINQGTPVIIF